MREVRQTIGGARQLVRRARQVSRSVPTLAAPLVLFLLTGCSSDRPYTAPPPGQSYRTQAPAAKPMAAAAASDGPSDPLIGDTGQAPADPLIGHDPLLGNDPMVGRGMPTKHSHWLRGRLRNERMTVLLNGVWYGSFSGTVDRDITMSLRQGTNTVTFESQPSMAGAAADMEVVESEHHPPIPPLATFHSRTGSGTSVETANGGPLKTVTQTFPFIAN